MNKELVEQIKDQFLSKFASSPHDVTEDEIEFIIKHECSCQHCGKSVFELYDFPEINIDDGELLCEDCVRYEYYNYCAECEESYDKRHYEPDYFVITKSHGREVGKEPGIYKVLARPFFYGNCVTGFDAYFDNSIELSVAIDLDAYKKIDCGDAAEDVHVDFLCPDCVSSFVKPTQLMKSVGKPCILFPRYEKELFRDYSPEKLKLYRQHLIERRIMQKGMIESGIKRAQYLKSNP